MNKKWKKSVIKTWFLEKKWCTHTENETRFLSFNNKKTSSKVFKYLNVKSATENFGRYGIFCVREWYKTCASRKNSQHKTGTVMFWMRLTWYLCCWVKREEIQLHTEEPYWNFLPKFPRELQSLSILENMVGLWGCWEKQLWHLSLNICWSEWFISWVISLVDGST